MPIDCVLGIDVGTGSLKAGLFSLDGALLGMARATYPVLSPEPDAREQAPDDWWSALVQSCHELLDQRPARARVVALAIAGQAPTLVPVDANLRPTAHAITWLDPRPSAKAEQLYGRLHQPVPVWGSWPAQAAWFVRNRPDAMRRTRWLLGCPDYLTSRLMCQPTALLSISQAELAAAELADHWFPPAWTPGAVIGEVSATAAVETGLPPGTAVVGGHVDGLLGVLGSGVRAPGEACINCGTSGTYSAIAPPPMGFPIFGISVAGTATNTSGNALDWLLRTVGSATFGYSEALAEAAHAPLGSEGLLFLPYLAGDRGAGHDAYARGAFVGLTLSHERHHLVRSVLEGVAFGFRAMQDWLQHGGAAIRDVRSVGGQAHSAVWNQIKADVLDRRLLVPEVVEAVAVGAAMLAGLGIGAFGTIDDAMRRLVRIDREFEPQPESAAQYARLFETYQQVYPQLRETNWRLHDFTQSS